MLKRFFDKNFLHINNLLILILTLSVFLRIIFMGKNSFGGDEILVLNVATKNIGDLLFNQTVIEMDNHPQLFTLIIKMFIPFFKNNFLLYRIIPLFFSCFSLVFIYKIARFFVSKPLALFSTLILSLHPILITQGSFLRNYSLFTFSVLGSYYYFELWKTKTSKFTTSMTIFFVTICMYSHFFALLFFAPYLLLFLINTINNKEKLMIFVKKLILPIIILLIPYYIFFYNAIVVFFQGQNISSLTFLHQIKSILGLFIHSFVGTGIISLPALNHLKIDLSLSIYLFVTLYFIIFIIWGVATKKLEKKLIELLFIVLFPIILLSFFKTRFIALRMFPYIPIFLWIITVAIIEKTRNHKLLLTNLVLISGLFLYMSFNYYRSPVNPMFVDCNEKYVAKTIRSELKVSSSTKTLILMNNNNPNAKSFINRTDILKYYLGDLSNKTDIVEFNWDSLPNKTISYNTVYIIFNSENYGTRYENEIKLSQQNNSLNKMMFNYEKRYFPKYNYVLILRKYSSK